MTVLWINPFLGGFSPAQFSGLKAWFDASDATSIAESSGSVTQWDDKSGNGLHLAQATAANQPSTGVATLNGLNVLSFNADFLAASSASDWKFLHDGTSYLIALVAKIGTVDNPNAIYGIAATAAAQVSTTGMRWQFDDRTSLSRNDTMAFDVNNSSGTLPVTIDSSNNYLDANNWTILQLLVDPDNATAASRFKAFRDSDASSVITNSATGSVSASNPLVALRLGARGDDIFGLVGEIAELVIVAGADATDTNRQKLRDYLQQKWGL